MEWVAGHSAEGTVPGVREKGFEGVEKKRAFLAGFPVTLTPGNVVAGAYAPIIMFD